MDNEHVFNRLASTPKSAALLAFAFSLTVAQEQAAPGDCLDKRVNCAQITGALTVLKKLGGPASTFCGSYLRIPTTTTKATTTTPTTTVTSYTSTTTIVRTACPAVAKRDARPVPFGNTEHAAVIEARANLPALSAFAAVQISLACSCLSVLPKVTITSTATASTSDTSTISATSTSCIQGQHDGGPLPDGAACNNPGQCFNVCCGNDYIDYSDFICRLRNTYGAEGFICFNG